MYEECFVSAEVVENDMDLSPGWLRANHFTQESHKIPGWCAGAWFVRSLRRFVVEGRIQRQGAMAIVFESVALGPSRR